MYTEIAVYIEKNIQISPNKLGIWLDWLKEYLKLTKKSCDENLILLVERIVRNQLRSHVMRE